MQNQTKIDFDVKRQKTFTLNDVKLKTDIQINATFIDKQEDLAEALLWCQFAPKKIGVDIETRGLDPHQHEMIMFQFGDINRQFVIDTRKVDITSLLPYIISEDITIVGQNLKFEYKFIKHKFNIDLINVQDTMLQEACLYTGYGMSNSLKELSYRYLNYEADKTIRMRFLEIKDEDFTKDEIIYGAYDVVLPLLIAEKQEIKIKEKGMETLAYLEHNYVKVVGDMEYKGLHFDKEKWKELYKYHVPLYEAQIELLDKYVIEHNLINFIDKQFDMFSPNVKKTSIQWSSSKQVIELFIKLGICPKEVSKTTKQLTWTVDAKVLKASLQTINKSISEDKKELIKQYLKSKELEQRITTFGESFFKYVNPVTGRLHSNYRQIISTGRSSSREPNLQNIPGDEAYRKCFTAPEGHKIINADYSGQETIVLANKSLDEGLLEFYRKGNSDMHSFIASKIYDIPYEEFIKATEAKDSKTNKPTSEQYELLHKRGIAKAAGFAINYGGTGYTIAKNLGLSTQKGEEVYDAYFNAFPGLKNYFDTTIQETLNRGYILINELTGRRLHFLKYKQMKSYENKPNKRSEYYKLRSQFSRLALNAPIQGTAGDITKNAAVRFRKWILDNNYRETIFITNVIHDEINVECPVELAEKAAEALQTCMEGAGDLWCKTVKLKADAVITDFWTH